MMGLENDVARASAGGRSAHLTAQKPRNADNEPLILGSDDGPAEQCGASFSRRPFGAFLPVLQWGGAMRCRLLTRFLFRLGRRPQSRPLLAHQNRVCRILR